MRQVNQLREDKENLESELVVKSQAFCQLRDRRRLTPLEVSQALPGGTVCVDFLSYKHENQPGHLVAFLLTPNGKVTRIRLQAALPVEKIVQSWRRAVLTGDAKRMDAAAAQLAERVWKPLQPHLQDAKTILISPDGPLTQFPFGALPGKRPGSYLIEDVAIGYVPSGRHLVEAFRNPARPAARGFLAVGGIDYRAEPDQVPTPGVAPAARVEVQQRDGFRFLAGTESEARRCRELFQRVFPGEPATLLTRAEPTNARLEGECGKRPRFLHLATHGFFESPARVTALAAGLRTEDRVLVDAVRAQEDRMFALTPLLRSGVALAGAARPPQADVTLGEVRGTAGILTAEEVAWLDLRGTELVVLSACDTGLGDIEPGEGVMGLQRAFHGAGARSVVSSLWRIDDAATTLLMEEFYTNLWQKKLPKLEALRQAQLFVLKNPERVTQRRRELGAELAKRDLDLGKQPPLPNGGKLNGRSHPALWAAFVLSGDIR